MGTEWHGRPGVRMQEELGGMRQARHGEGQGGLIFVTDLSVIDL
jgi:hypothetical protein